MRSSACLIAFALLAGCVATPPEISSPPPPAPQEIAAMRAVETRVVPVPIESVFPHVIDVLLDNNFVVRSVDTRLGFVAFGQQWMDPTQPTASVSEEGTILFTSAGAGSTQMRVMLAGNWHDLEVGGHSYASRGAAGQGPSEQEYRKILDMLQRGLTSH
jgi:hypothetical protein